MACLLKATRVSSFALRAPRCQVLTINCPNMAPKKLHTQKEEHSTCEYRIENNGKYTRYVTPYFQDFRTHAKGRWLGREVLEVFCREFGAHPPSYWINALRNGQVRINNRVVAADYKFKNSDALLHRAHRHEPPVFGEILLVGETDEIVAISKPPSLPMHPCGAYRHNSLEYIMKKETLVPNQPNLLVVHRLDRVTSGLVIMAKSKAAAGQISQEIRDKATTKVYLARVKGRFPDQPNMVSHLRELAHINLEEFADETEDYEHNGFQEPVAPRKRSHPATDMSNGETDSSVNAPDSSASVLDTAPTPTVAQASVGGKSSKKQHHDKKNQFGRGDDINVEDLPPLVRTVLSAEEVGQAQNVGVLFSLPVSEALENAHTKRSAVIASCSGLSSESASSSAPSDREVWVKCPLGVVSQRDGVHACDPTGKPSLSIFRCLGYDAATDTSLVECRPYTGRTHQLRLHLQLLGTPIANDPCYGGVLFYGDDERRAQAVAAVKEMRAKGIIPLSKVPHFGDPEVDNLLLTVKSEAKDSSEACTSADCASQECAPALVDEVATAPLPGESEDDYLIRTCRYCQDNSSVELEHLLHCDGIWLHAWRYTGPPLIKKRPEVPLIPENQAPSSSSSLNEGEQDALKDETGLESSLLVDSPPAAQTVERVARRWAFQAPLPAWAAPFSCAK